VAKFIYKIIATGFFSGFIPYAPGTFATLASLAPFLILKEFLGGSNALILLLIFSIVIGTLSAEKYSSLINEKDPGVIVIDEWAGFYLSLTPIVLLGMESYLNFAIIFLAFRMLDITKPWPISQVENLPGGIGIMADDILAGLFIACASISILSIM
jgi:phosphatidylglycerophosphatase A